MNDIVFKVKPNDIEASDYIDSILKNIKNGKMLPLKGHIDNLDDFLEGCSIVKYLERSRIDHNPIFKIDFNACKILKRKVKISKILENNEYLKVEELKSIGLTELMFSEYDVSIYLINKITDHILNI